MSEQLAPGSSALFTSESCFLNRMARTGISDSLLVERNNGAQNRDSRLAREFAFDGRCYGYCLFHLLLPQCSTEFNLEKIQILKSGRHFRKENPMIRAPKRKKDNFLLSMSEARIEITMLRCPFSPSGAQSPIFVE